MELKEENEELKTHKLPFGKLRFRKQREKWSYDEDKLLQAIDEAGLEDLIKVKKSVDKAELKKRLIVSGSRVINPDTGELIEGVEIEERGEKFSIDY